VKKTLCCKSVLHEYVHICTVSYTSTSSCVVSICSIYNYFSVNMPLVLLICLPLGLDRFVELMY